MILLAFCSSVAMATNNLLHDASYLSSAPSKGSFGHDVKLLRKFDNGLIILSSGKSQIAISPKLQARVMISSFNSEKDRSLGWINEELLKGGKFTPHISAFGGEDRFWLGPEGGQFSLYFKKGCCRLPIFSTV